MRILLTRPAMDSEQTAEMLRRRGHTTIISPVLEIRFLEGPEIEMFDVHAIVSTSANGIRALARRTRLRDLPVFAVGPQTANAARSAGFHRVRDSSGDAEALLFAVESWATPDATVLFAAGRHRGSELERTLQDRGCVVRTEILYEAAEQPALTSAAAAAISSGELDGVMLFSSRSAAIFVKQVLAVGLAPCCANLIALCISKAVANCVLPLAFREVRVASHPDESGMLALLT